MVPLRTLPGVSWPAIPSGHVAQFWTLARTLERTQWLAPEEIVSGQLAQVRSLLALCARHVPYYRDLLHEARIAPEDVRSLADFRRIPVLKRAVYREQFPRFQATALPAGLTVTVRNKTSGTEGLAIDVWQTNVVCLWWNACWLRDLQWCGIDTRGTLAVIRNFAVPRGHAIMDGVEWPQWSAHLAPLVETGRSFAMDIQQDPRRQLDWLLRIQPDFFLSTPSNARYLAELLLGRNQRVPNLKCVQVVAETLTDLDQVRIASAFGVPVKNLYSCMEAGYIASPCPDGHGLHVHAENVLFELLNDEGEPCQPGETGRVVLTTLRNHITPFVRYEISDIATAGPERCPCGRGLPLVTRVHGKVRPMLQLAGGRRKSSLQLVHSLLKLGVYLQHQIVQQAIDHFVVRIVPGPTWTPERADSVVRVVQDFVEAPVHVEVQPVARLDLTVGGKVRDVVIEIPE